LLAALLLRDGWPGQVFSPGHNRQILPRYKENPGAALGPDGIAPAVLYMVSALSGDQTGKILGVPGPRSVREMRMMEMEGWTPPFTGWNGRGYRDPRQRNRLLRTGDQEVGAEIQIVSFRGALFARARKL
jgi:hypothetical protein